MHAKLLFSIPVACLLLARSAAAEGPAVSTIPPTPAVSEPTTSTPTTAPPIGSASVAPSAADTTLYQSRSPNRFWLYTGLVTLAGTYVVTAVVAANDGSARDKDLYIPIVGPWTNLAGRTSTSAGDAVLIAGSGVLQGAGALMFVSSLFMKEKFATATISAGPVTMTPVATPGGVGAVGTF